MVSTCRGHLRIEELASGVSVLVDAKGAHFLLQAWTKMLDEELREKFNHWYPGFEKNPKAAKMAV
jgi:hypothetical protein